MPIATTARGAALPSPPKPELHEIDLSAVPVPPDEEELSEPEIAEPGPAAAEPKAPEPEKVVDLTPSAGIEIGTTHSIFGRPEAEGDEGGPPTEALMVGDELADSGPSGASTRRRV